MPRAALVCLMVTFVACGSAPRKPIGPTGAANGCPDGMARVEPEGSLKRAYCIDRYEAGLVELAANAERPFSPYEQVNGRVVKAVSREGVVPQAYVSRDEAEVACKRADKRLCTEGEWVHACMGSQHTTYPYGADRKAGVCNDSGKAPLPGYYASPGASVDPWQAMNDPRLNQMSGTVAKTGSHPACKSSYGVYDMMGNLHEWVADREGTFLGGYYLDTKLNGDGCHYKTVAHGPVYHDYSTGFRCCRDTGP